jgi:hypothetical protein
MKNKKSTISAFCFICSKFMHCWALFEFCSERFHCKSAKKSYHPSEISAFVLFALNSCIVEPSSSYVVMRDSTVKVPKEINYDPFYSSCARASTLFNALDHSFQNDTLRCN